VERATAHAKHGVCKADGVWIAVSFDMALAAGIALAVGDWADRAGMPRACVR